jgi:chitinase
MRADRCPTQWSRHVAPALVGLVVLAGCVNFVADIPPAARHGEAGTRFVYSPYKHVPIALDPATHALSTAVRGTPTPIVVDGHSTLPPGVTALTLAFATGECGTETWDGMDPQAWAEANLRALGRAGIDYVISTGGEGGVFTCATDAGMEAFIAHYMSPHLIGFDFDIEHAQSEDIVASLVQRIATAQRRHPKLRFSFTLATWAANDGSLASLNADGERVMRAIRDARFDDFYINLMVMDYGEAKPGNCVVAAGVCDMGQSAIQATRNLNTRHSVPFHRIELTPMLGVNDVVANVFSLDDARTLARFVRDNRLAGVHFWSLDRDTACPPGVSGVSSMCSGLQGVAALGFTAAIRDGLR